MVAVLVVSRHLVTDRMTRRKFMKIRREKTDKLQKGKIEMICRGLIRAIANDCMQCTNM